MASPLNPASGIPSPRDPREIITDEAFRVSPELLGRPLAGPWRRGFAMLADLVLVSLLANAPSVIFGVAVATVLLRASIKPAQGGILRRSARFATRAVTAVVVFGVAVSLFNVVAGLVERDEEEVAGVVDAVEVGTGGVRLSGIDGLIAGAQVLSVMRAADEAEAQEAMGDLVDALEDAGMTDAEMLALLGQIEVPGGDRPWVRAAVDSAVVRLQASAVEEARADSVRALTADDVLASYVAAISAGDTATAAELREELPALLSAEELAALQSEVDRREDRIEALEQALTEAEEGGGILAMLGTLANDFGLGFGWTGLYFTAFCVIWRGRTPGKRLLKIRVVQLNGAPIGWWDAFQRFGGYAAGLATGLLGFLQIFWDDNRQGIQDQIARTVVVRD